MSFIPALSVVAREPWLAASASDLLGSPGAMAESVELPSGRHAYDACCPGCGRVTGYLSPDEYPIYGNPGGRTCTRPIHWTGCCGWGGRLRNGRWRISIRGLLRYVWRQFARAVSKSAF